MDIKFQACLFFLNRGSLRVIQKMIKVHTHTFKEIIEYQGVRIA